MHLQHLFFFFFFNDTATTEIYTLSLHDALPISLADERRASLVALQALTLPLDTVIMQVRSEEHTSELQSPCNLVCRLLLEKKKKKDRTTLSETRVILIVVNAARRHCVHISERYN